MNNNDFKKIIEGIQNKIGQENSSIIADDLGTLISDNINMNKTITEKENVIKEKEDLNQKLVFANSSLLQQVGVPEDNSGKKASSKSIEVEEEEKISWDDCFDKKGRFLR